MTFNQHETGEINISFNSYPRKLKTERRKETFMLILFRIEFQQWKAIRGATIRIL